MSSKKQIKVEPLQFKSYLTVIKNSVNSNQFRNFFAKVDGVEKDILNDGEFSCAFFASSILLLFKQIKEPHMTVVGLIKDLKESGWDEIDNPTLGSVLVWQDKQAGDGSLHKHIGFYVGNNLAVSNGEAKKSPQFHHYTFGQEGEGYRKIELVLINSGFQK